MDMTEYPKKFAKGDSVKTAANRRQEVQLKFAGFKQVSMDVTPTTEAPPASHVDRVNALTGADADQRTDTEREADEQAAAAKPKPKAPRADTESNTAPRN